jgi:hypothetical protein
VTDLIFPGGVPKGLEVEGFYERHETLALRDRKGGDINEFPADLRVREFPAEVAHA